jgi:hypothetical protein
VQWWQFVVVYILILIRKTSEPEFLFDTSTQTARAAPRAQGLEHICNTSFGDPRPAKCVKIPPEIKWETPMAAQVIAAVHGDIKE